MKKVLIICIFAFINKAYSQDLLESYHLALQNNPILKQAYFEKLAVSESKYQSIAKMLPTLSVTIKSSKERLIITHLGEERT